MDDCTTYSNSLIGVSVGFGLLVIFNIICVIWLCRDKICNKRRKYEVEEKGKSGKYTERDKICNKRSKYERFHNDEEKGQSGKYTESVKMAEVPEPSREFGQKLRDEQHKNNQLLKENEKIQFELKEIVNNAEVPEQSHEFGQKLGDEQHKNDQLLKENEKIQLELKEMQKQQDQNQKKIERLTEAKLALEQEKDDALRRLSALMSNRLRDGNPNVVDLSDQNRPLKVGEHFSELYDNQWTDVFTVMQEQFGDKKSERDIIGMLLKIVEHCFEKCKQAAETEMSELLKDVHAISAKVALGESKLVEDLLQRIKEERKINAVDKVPDTKKVIQCLQQELSVTADSAAVFDSDEVSAYVQECLKLCYLMVNQDPPMVIECRPDSSNVENFKAYQTRGTSIVYVVWPILFLHEGGPLVSKGVAELANY